MKPIYQLKAENMRNKRKFLGVIGFILITAVLSLTGCSDPMGSGTTYTSSGTSTNGSGGWNTGGPNVPKSASRIYFIRMGMMTEASGTLCGSRLRDNNALICGIVLTFPHIDA